jgi:hypothetical protein
MRADLGLVRGGVAVLPARDIAHHSAINLPCQYISLRITFERWGMDVRRLERCLVSGRRHGSRVVRAGLKLTQRPALAAVIPETGDVNWFCAFHWKLLNQLVSLVDETPEDFDGSLEGLEGSP